MVLRRRRGGYRIVSSKGPSAENGDGSFATALKQINWWLKEKKALSTAAKNMTFLDDSKRNALVAGLQKLGYGKRRRGGMKLAIVRPRRPIGMGKQRRTGKGWFENAISPFEIFYPYTNRIAKNPSKITPLAKPVEWFQTHKDGSGRKRRRGGLFGMSWGDLDPSRPFRQAVADPKSFFSKPSNIVSILPLPGGPVASTALRYGVKKGLESQGRGRKRRVGKGWFESAISPFSVFYPYTNAIARNPVPASRVLDIPFKVMTGSETGPFELGTKGTLAVVRGGRKKRRGGAKVSGSVKSDTAKKPRSAREWFSTANEWLRKSNFISKTLKDLKYPEYSDIAHALGYGRSKIPKTLGRMLEGRGVSAHRRLLKF